MGDTTNNLGILNYRAGNAPSVYYALRKLGVDCRLIDTPVEIEESARIILPGVGSARATMESLDALGCVDVLRRKVLQDKTPFLGICIGLQILFEHSEEDDADCLAWLGGTVRRFENKSLRVPHIGWNQVDFQRLHPVLAGIESGSYFYFVNSYYATPKNPEIVLGTTDYGSPFCSLVAGGNIIATQFHTEKSGPVGLALLKNFATLPEEVFRVS